MITVEGLWKRFRLYRDRHQSLKARLVSRRRSKYEEFWALKDVSFEVTPGESLGIIGANGCGKSTLLKCLTGIYKPTQGALTVDGHVSALIELGAGFHPELSGRENIFLNSSILGLDQNTIKSRFDQIVEFAGLEDFIESPVKVYSSGMTVRLGFAIAANADAITALETSKENTVNKSTNVITDATSDTKFPSVKAIKTYVDNKVGTITDDQTAAEVNLTTPIDIDKDGLNETNIEAAIVALADKLVPAGTIILSGAASAPSGYLLCDGSSVKRATYPKLFDAIGIAFGVGNLTLPGEESDQNFSLPDMRGRFARGVDGGAGNDPDRASRTTSNTGGNTGDNVGSLQADELKNHKHALNYPNNTNNEDQGFPQDGFDAVWATDRDNASGSDAVSNTGGNETRPKNVNLNYFIKY